MLMLAEKKMDAGSIPGLKAQVSGDAHTKQEREDLREGKLVHSNSRRQENTSLTCYLPASAHETYYGRNVHVSHIVTLTCQTGMGDFITNPTVERDFVLYRALPSDAQPSGQGAPNQGTPAPQLPPEIASLKPVMYPVVRHTLDGMHGQNVSYPQQQPAAEPYPTRDPGPYTGDAPMPITPLGGSGCAGLALRCVVCLLPIDERCFHPTPYTPKGGAPYTPPAAQIQMTPPAAQPVAPAQAAAPAPPAAPSDPFSVEGLCNALKHSFDALGDTRRWVQGGGGSQALSPGDVAQIVAAVEMGIMQATVMHEVMQCPGAKAITGDHLAAAVKAAQDSSRGDVVREMAPNCQDKQAAGKAVKPLLSTFQWTLVSTEFN